MKFEARFLLLSSASAAATIFLLPGEAHAQATTCSKIGTTITCTDGSTTVLTAPADPATNVVPGPGLATINTTAPSTVGYAAPGSIATTGSRAMSLSSTGGPLAFVPSGDGAPVNVSTTGGAGAHGLVLNTSGQSATVTVGNISTSGTNSYGVLSTAGADLVLRTGNITTTGATSRGIDAAFQTGNVSVTAGNLTTTGVALNVIGSNTSAANIVAGQIRSGDRGLFVRSGSLAISTGDIATSTNAGATPGGLGLVAQALSGNAVVRVGTVNTANGGGIDARAVGATGSVDIGCAGVTTSNNSLLVVANAVTALAPGSITVNCGALTTTGANSNGVYSQSTGGNVVLNTGVVNTAGVVSFGVTGKTGGAGNVTTNTAPITTTGNASGGLYLRADTGAIDAGFSNITTSGVTVGFDVPNALDAQSNGTINLRGAGATLTTNGAGVTAAVVNGAGVTGNLGNVVTTGAASRGAIITSSAPVNLIVGNVTTTSNGLTVNAGANNVTLTTGTVASTENGATGTVINATGAVTFSGGKQSATGANALRIAGGAGVINVTLAGASTGGTGTAVAITGAGPLSFANTGLIITTGPNSSGVNISGVTTAAVNCGNVSTSGSNSPALVVVANGTTSVTCGTVTTTGSTSDAILVSNAAGTTTVTGGGTTATGAGSRGIVVSSSSNAAADQSTITTGVVTANANAVMATGGAGNVVVNANGNVSSSSGTGITAATAGSTLVTINAGTTTSGVQGVNLQGNAGNSLIVNGTLRNTGGTTPYTVLAGGPFTLTLGPSGTIAGPLAFTSGNDTFNNQGTFALPATVDFGAGNDTFNNSGTVTAFAGTTAVSNLETFNNIGALIEMRNGAANNVVSLGSAAYNATGGARLGIDVSGATGTLLSDRLVIGGATGTTTVLANIAAPVVDPTGALVVDSTLNNLASGQFVLAGNNNFGLINYSLQVRGGDVFMVSSLDARAYDLIYVARQVRDLWYKSADVYNGYAAARRTDFGRSRSSPLGIWAQLYGQSERTRGNSRTVSAFGNPLVVADRMRTDYRGAQGGVDFGSANFVVGVTGGYERALGTSTSGTELETEGHNYGAYAQFGTSSGLYAGALVKRDDFDLVVDNGAIQSGPVKPRAHSTGADGEVGFRGGAEGSIGFDFGAGVSYVRSKIDVFNFGNVIFDNGRATSVRGRLYGRVSFAGAASPFLEARGFHEFRGSTNYQLRTGSASSILDGAGKGSWVRVEGGFGGRSGPLLSAWGEVGDTRGYGVRAGFRF